MVWNKLKSGSKLAIGFGVILSLFATIGILDIRKTSEILNKSKQLFNEYLPISTISTQISETAQKAMYAQRAYRYTEDEQYLAEGKILLDSLHSLLQEAQTIGKRYPHQTNFNEAVENSTKALEDYRKLLAETVTLNRKLTELRQQQEELSLSILDKGPKASADYILKSSLQYQKYRITGNDLYITLAIESNRLAQLKGSKITTKELNDHLAVLVELEKVSTRIAELGTLNRDASNNILKNFYTISKHGMESTRRLSNATAESIIKSRTTMAIWFLVVIFMAAVMAYFITKDITNPIRKCVNVARQIAGGNFDITIKPNSAREAGILMESLETIGKRLKEVTEQTNRAHLEIEAQNQLKSTFLANLTHEINIPTNAIIEFASQLSSDKLTEKDRAAYISRIRNNGEELLALINDILYISAIEARQIKINKTHESLEDFFQVRQHKAQELLKREEKTGVKVSVSFPPDYSHEPITTDFTKLHQITQNLISNAMKFTEKGEIEIGFTIPNPHTIQFFVKDSGIGISTDNFEKIFERYYKIEEQGKTYRGIGLGLPISKGLVEGLGGKIWVESEIETGSTFFFTVPLVMVKTTQTKA